MLLRSFAALLGATLTVACTHPTPPSADAPASRLPSSASAQSAAAPIAPASASAAAEERVLVGGPSGPSPGPAACLAKGGICRSGARCDGPAAGRFIDLATSGDETCGSAGAGMVCCVKCKATADSPDSCCGDGYGAVSVCVDGKVGCMPGQKGIRRGEKCPWER